MSDHLILTTGVYDLIKDHVRRRKVTDAEGDLLTLELKRAKQVRRRDLPDNVVDIDTVVTVKDVETGTEETYTFVPPGKSSMKHKTQSIMTPIGLALVGYTVGSLITWPVNGVDKQFEILKVDRL